MPRTFTGYSPENLTYFSMAILRNSLNFGLFLTRLADLGKAITDSCASRLNFSANSLTPALSRLLLKFMSSDTRGPRFLAR